MLFSAPAQTFRGIEGVQVTPAIPVTQISSTEKSEGKTKNLIFENLQVSNEIICSLFFWRDCYAWSIFLAAETILRRRYPADTQGRTLQSFKVAP